MKNYRTRAAIQALDLVANERARQIEKFGFTADHDDQHEVNGELALGGAAYALKAIQSEGQSPADYLTDIWPWECPMTGDKRTCLVKAAALLLAALEQDLRPELKESQKQ